MIVDVPTSEDFEITGLGFLNLAWDSVLSLVFELDMAADSASWSHVINRESSWDDEDGAAEEQWTKKYWEAAQRPLATAIVLAQQGTEFLLKARIAAFSPFLLISGYPGDWPKGCNKHDTSFADFRTIDAQDLIRAHDTTASVPLTDEFKERFEELRRFRNTIMHTVDRRIRVTPVDVIDAILEVSHSLLGPFRWLPHRREFLTTDHTSTAYDSIEYVENSLAGESLKVVQLLKPIKLERFFGLRRRQRRYICYHCTMNCNDHHKDIRLAQLRPAKSGSKNIFCFICGTDRPVVRKPCKEPDCKGNVLDAEWDVCLTCGVELQSQ